MNEYDDIRYQAFANISQLSNKLQNVMDIGMKEITSKQWLPLILIGTFKTPPTLNELAKRCGITHQSAKQLIEKLDEKGYVTISRDEADKRYLLIELTDLGRQWSIDNEKRNRTFIYDLFADISKEEIEVFMNIQKKLIDFLDERKRQVKEGEYSV